MIPSCVERKKTTLLDPEPPFIHMCRDLYKSPLLASIFVSFRFAALHFFGRPPFAGIAKSALAD